MEETPNRSPLAGKVLVIGIVSVFLILGIVLIISLLINREPAARARTDALASSSDACVTCHKNATPGIVDQYGHSTMAAKSVACTDCHQVEAAYPGAVNHEGTFILASPTSAKCEKCHQAEVAQFNQSRHALPAYVAVGGTKDLTPELMAMYKSIPEGSFAPDKARNAVAAVEGPVITRFACETCHNVGKPAADGSVGECQKCHLRHEFSLEQVRKPETCNACHIGPDHPQWEIYQESPHGIAYQTNGQNFNWEAKPGTLTVKDFPAPTCAICHFSGFGGTATTHDVGDRLSWYLFSSISERRPAYQDNIVRMQSVCLQCHNKNFIDDYYKGADLVVIKVNDWIKQSDQIIQPLKDQKLLTAAPFDEPIDFTYFETWHHWGRTTKFGTWMQGPDYTQWHGAYEVVKGLAELQAEVNQKLKDAGVTK
jgi:hydroxylamine dehydrogenase